MTSNNYKVLFSGPMGAGKTTAIRAISDRLPMQTDVRATDETAERKAATTVAMDYGTIRLGTSEVVHLYGTPGQDRFDFMWEILAEGALGLVLLIDNARPDPLADLVRFLEAYDDFIASTAVVIGITRCDIASRPNRAQYMDLLTQRSLLCPVFTVDARSSSDVSLLVRSLLYTLDPEVSAS